MKTIALLAALCCSGFASAESLTWPYDACWSDPIGPFGDPLSPPSVCNGSYCSDPGSSCCSSGSCTCDYLPNSGSTISQCCANGKVPVGGPCTYGGSPNLQCCGGETTDSYCEFGGTCCAVTAYTGADYNPHALPCATNTDCCDYESDGLPTMCINNECCIPDGGHNFQKYPDGGSDPAACCSGALVHANDPWCACIPDTDTTWCDGPGNACDCNADSKCCSGMCVGGYCSSTCGGIGVECLSQADCCSGNCYENRCAAPCETNGTCSTDGQCCSFDCVSGNCLCTLTGHSCIIGGDLQPAACCSGACNGTDCCNPLGIACTTNANCCSGVCSSVSHLCTI